MLGPEEWARRSPIGCAVIATAFLLMVGILMFAVSWPNFFGPNAVPPSTPTPTPTPVAAANVPPAPPPSTPTPPLTPTVASPPSVPFIAGSWEFTVDVTETRNVCAGEENAPPSIDTVRIQQFGPGLEQIAVFGFGDNAGVGWAGLIQGASPGVSVTFRGQRDEDEGVTRAEFRLTLSADALSMSGEELWDWRGIGGTCPDGRSLVTARKIAGP